MWTTNEKKYKQLNHRKIHAIVRHRIFLRPIVSTHSKSKRDKKRATVKADPFIPLVQTWRKQYEALSQYFQSNADKDLQLYNQCQQRWVRNVKNAHGKNTLNTLLNNSLFSAQKEKSYCVRDAINVCSDWSNKNQHVRLWGVTVTGSVGHLLAATRTANEIAHMVGHTIEAPVAFVGAFPMHVACLLSPQAIGDITKFSSSSLFDENNVVVWENQEKLLKQLEPYLFQTHCDLEKIATHSATAMGTMILTFASLETATPLKLYEGNLNSSQSQAWSEGVAQWKERQEIPQLFFTVPEQWSRSLTLGVKTYIDFVWGMNARMDNKPQKVLDVDRVFVDYQDDKIVLDAHTPDGYFASVELPVETTMWPLHICLDDLQERGIRLLPKQE